MKFRAHETFFIRKGWITKGLKNVDIKANVFTDKKVSPTDTLGIGTNMCKSLRYWLQVLDLTVEVKEKGGKRSQNITDFGRLVFDKDRYVEELGTLYALQYKLASNKDLATSWYYFFNKFSLSEFTKEDYINEIQKYISMEEEEVALTSLEGDFTCIVNTYLPRHKTNARVDSPENNIESPFAELGLIDITGNRTYKKSIPSVNSINPWIALAVIVDQAKGNKEISISSLMNDDNNIGKVYNLDSVALLELLHKIEKIDELKIIRTAGLDVIHINNDYNFLDCIQKYYESFEF